MAATVSRGFGVWSWVTHANCCSCHPQLPDSSISQNMGWFRKQLGKRTHHFQSRCTAVSPGTARCRCLPHMKCHRWSLPGTVAVSQGLFPDVTEISQVYLWPRAWTSWLIYWPPHSPFQFGISQVKFCPHVNPCKPICVNWGEIQPHICKEHRSSVELYDLNGLFQLT